MPPFNKTSLIFPLIQPLPQALNVPRHKADIMCQIQSDPQTFSLFQALKSEEQEAFVGFCTGNRGLKITYDPFFKHIFDTEIHPERLSRLLSCLLGQTVQVKKVLTPERRRMSEDSPLLIMDLLVQLTDGSLVDVEMQRIGYHFPLERSFCYASDLLVRQHDLISAAKRKHKSPFSYRDIKPVYVITLMEKSSGPFLKDHRNFIHYSDFSFDTGLRAEPLQHFIYVSLDIFRKMPHNNLTELEAWLYFLCSDSPEDILRIIQRYPFFQELYQDIVNFRFQPKELIAMYSKALSIMDRNTVYYMIDELKADNAKKDLELSQKDSEISKLKTEIELLLTQLKQQDNFSTP